jgi:hypothetical protein
MLVSSRVFTTHYDVVQGLPLTTLASGGQFRPRAAFMLAYLYDMYAIDREPENGPSPFIVIDGPVETHRGGSEKIYAHLTLDEGPYAIHLLAFFDNSCIVSWHEKGQQDYFAVPWSFDVSSAFGPSTPPSIDIVADDLRAIIAAFRAALPIGTGDLAMADAKRGLVAAPPFAHYASAQALDAADRFMTDLAIWFHEARPEWGSISIGLRGRQMLEDGAVGSVRPIIFSSKSVIMDPVEAHVQAILDRDDSPLPLFHQVRFSSDLNINLGNKRAASYPHSASAHEKLHALQTLEPLMQDCPPPGPATSKK